MTQQGRVKLLPSILLCLLASHEYPDIGFFGYFVCFSIFFRAVVNHGIRISLQEGFRYVERDYRFPRKYLKPSVLPKMFWCSNTYKESLNYGSFIQNSLQTFAMWRSVIWLICLRINSVFPNCLKWWTVTELLTLEKSLRSRILWNLEKVQRQRITQVILVYVSDSRRTDFIRSIAK